VTCAMKRGEDVAAADDALKIVTCGADKKPAQQAGPRVPASVVMPGSLLRGWNERFRRDQARVIG
jgi:hypothetical protein